MSWSNICLIWSEADILEDYSELLFSQTIHNLFEDSTTIPHHIESESEMTFSISLQDIV